VNAVRQAQREAEGIRPGALGNEGFVETGNACDLDTNGHGVML
jgi:hypothetical protein